LAPGFRDIWAGESATRADRSFIAVRRGHTLSEVQDSPRRKVCFCWRLTFSGRDREREVSPATRRSFPAAVDQIRPFRRLRMSVRSLWNRTFARHLSAGQSCASDNRSARRPRSVGAFGSRCPLCRYDLSFTQLADFSSGLCFLNGKSRPLRGPDYHSLWATQRGGGQISYAG
jgi:hypothetical protein